MAAPLKIRFLVFSPVIAILRHACILHILSRVSRIVQQSFLTPPPPYTPYSYLLLDRNIIMALRRILLPTEGGGSLRRFLRVRQRLLRDKWHDSRPLRGPVPLLDMRDPDDVSDLRHSLIGRRSWPFRGWRSSNDGVIGGYSTSEMAFVDGNDDDDELSRGAPPYLRWSRNINTTINTSSHLARNVTRSGYAYSDSAND